MKLQGVLFDLWGTLIFDTPERGRPRLVKRTADVKKALAGYGVELDSELVERALQGAARTLTALHDTGKDTDSIGRVHILIGELGKETATPVPEAAYSALETAITQVMLDLAPPAGPNTVEALAAVKALGMKTALISNVGTTTSVNLMPMLDAHGFTPYLDELVFSDVLQLAKPAKEIFDHALSALGLTADVCAFVGDAPHNDVFGAQNAGLFTVQFGDKAHDTISPDARIFDMAELLPTLAARGLLELQPAK